MGDLRVSSHWRVSRFILGSLLFRWIERRGWLLDFNIIVLVEGVVLFLLSLHFIVNGMMVPSNGAVNSSSILIQGLIAICSVLGWLELILDADILLWSGSLFLDLKRIINRLGALTNFLRDLRIILTISVVVFLNMIVGTKSTGFGSISKFLFETWLGGHFPAFVASFSFTA